MSIETFKPGSGVSDDDDEQLITIPVGGTRGSILAGSVSSK